MDRLFALLGIGALLLFAPARVAGDAQMAFFSMLFPQLMQDVQDMQTEATPGEAVFL